MNLKGMPVPKAPKRQRNNVPQSLWEPLPSETEEPDSPQALAYISDADELFYGGSAGGGKSDLLLGLASTAHKRSIIFRREYPQLKDLVIRSREILGSTNAQYNGQSMIWREIPGSRTLEFGAVQHEEDKRKYLGRAHDLKAFDEVSSFTEAQYRFLIGWARTTVPGQRVRVVVAGNPPTTAEGEWVIQRWAPWLDPEHLNPAEPGELRWFAIVDKEEVECESGEIFTEDGEEIIPKSRTFIPARVTDNPHLMETGYTSVLQNMPEPLRSQLLYGDFTIGIEANPWQVIPTEWVRAAQARWTETEPSIGLSALGVDVARGGNDQTTIVRRYGQWFAPLDKYPGKATPDGPHVAGLVMERLNNGATVYIDVIGIGASPYDTLKAQKVKVVGVNVSEASKAKDRTGQFQFANKRAELWWKFREALEPDKGDDLALPPDRELFTDLITPRWKQTARGIQVESKEDIRKRLSRSPDCGDAAVMALQQPLQRNYILEW